MASNDTSQGVSNCYIFKSRLQEYAQKAALTTPIYHTIKEGPSHQPLFKSSVVVNDVTYDSLPGFLNRKAAEQSAAEVALVELAKSGATDGSVSQPVHETGLSKNILQEYAQKMNYAIPSYDCKKEEKQGRGTLFSCTVDIGGIKYIGGAAKTKKEAELKAARIALLAIEMNGSGSAENSDGHPIYTVIPSKRKVPEPVIKPHVQEPVRERKRKKGRFFRRQRKRRSGDRGKSMEAKRMGSMDINKNGEAATGVIQTDSFSALGTDSMLNGNEGGGKLESVKSDLVSCGYADSNDGHLTSLMFEQNDLGTGSLGISSMS